MKLFPVGPSALKPLPEVAMRILAGAVAAGSAFAGFHLLSLFLPVELPFRWFWLRSLALAICLVPAWLMLEPPSGRAGFRRAELLLLSACAVLLPFVLVAAGSGLAGPFLGPDIAFWAGALLLAALAEEIQFRGFLQDLFSIRGMKLPGIVVSGVLFSFVHMNNPSAGLLSTLNIFLFGVLLSMLRVRTGGLAAPAILHWLWNSVTGIVLGLNVSGLELPSLFKPSGGLPWGGFGPEESPILTVCLALLCAAFVFGIDSAGPISAAGRVASRKHGAALDDSPDENGGGRGDPPGDLRSAVRESHSWFFYPGLPRT
ncbi:CPBP family intramembrane metalloprotease [Candidatus Fermentibacteria bacterium]|nr:CPBP family intramembrane metalloprotease [Candidatus Fermentibacteria bacterium]